MDHLNIGAAAREADDRVNANVKDITSVGDVSKTDMIDEITGSVLEQIQHYKQIGAYPEDTSTKEGRKEGMMFDYMGLNAETPEEALITLRESFERKARIEDAAAGRKLNALATDTFNALNSMKHELADSFTADRRAERQVQEHWEEYLPEVTDPSQFSQTADYIANMGEALGQRPKVEKLERMVDQNDILLNSLRLLGTNTLKYKQAEFNYKKISGGRPMEYLNKDILAAFQAVEAKFGPNTVEARGLFSNTFKSALDSLKSLDKVLTAVMFGPEAATPHAEEHMEHDAPDLDSHDIPLMTEEEMSMMLSVIIEGTPSDNVFAQTYNINNAVDFMTPGDGLQDYQRTLLLPANTIYNASNLIIDFANHPDEAISHLASVGSSLFTAETQRKIAQFAAYGWANTTPLQKTNLVAQLILDIVITKQAGSVVMGALGKTATGAKTVLAMGRATGVTTVAMASIATIATPILENLPSLVKYGTMGVEIADGLLKTTTTLTKKAVHLAHKLHTQVHYGEVVARCSAGAYHETHDRIGHDEHGDHPELLPIYQELHELDKDVQLAIDYSGHDELNIENTDALEEAKARIHSAPV